MPGHIFSITSSQLLQAFFIGPHWQALAQRQAHSPGPGELGFHCQEPVTVAGPPSCPSTSPHRFPFLTDHMDLPLANTHDIHLSLPSIGLSRVFEQQGLVNKPLPLCQFKWDLSTYLFLPQPIGQTTISPSAFNKLWTLPLKWPLHTSLLQALQTSGFPGIYTD